MENLCPLPTPGSNAPPSRKDKITAINAIAAPKPSFHQAITNPASMPTRKSKYRKIVAFAISLEKSWRPADNTKGKPKRITKMLPILAIVREMFARTSFECIGKPPKCLCDEGG